MKLQKLVFFAHGYYLAASKLERDEPTPLIDELFEAWPYGPVSTTLYSEFKEFGRREITRLGFVFDPTFGARIVAVLPESDELFEKIMGFVWKQYGEHSSLSLSDITHKKDGAWDKARRAAHGIRGKDVSNEYILADFEPLVSRRQHAERH